MVRVQNAVGGGASGTDLAFMLDSIRATAKGDDRTKSVVGEHLIPQLMRLVGLHATNLPTALAAAKLLRSITVSSTLPLLCFTLLCAFLLGVYPYRV